MKYTSLFLLSGKVVARPRALPPDHRIELIRSTCMDVRGLAVGQRVYAVGTPKGLERTLSEGIISSLRPRARSFVIQTTAPMSRVCHGLGTPAEGVA